MKTNNNKTLSSREIWLSNKANPRTKADAKNGTNWINGVFFGLNDIPMQETPKIRAMLDIFDPTTAPIAMLSLWFNIDDMPTKISGADVPRATTVKPIVNSLIPSFFAINDELSTNLSAPQIKTAREVTRPRKLTKNSMIHFTLDIIKIDYVSIIKNTI